MATQEMRLYKYSLGTGDRFAHQAKAQLQACIQALQQGITIVPVWNKSNREHLIIGSEPESVRESADAAVQALAWTLPYFCDADHITLQTVDRFLDACDFFTIDVADSIGRPAQGDDVQSFVLRHPELLGRIRLDGADGDLEITLENLTSTAREFLTAVSRAGEVYRKIENSRGKGNSIIEVSMDETDHPQTPAELLIILAALAEQGIPLQTIAPKFTGRFNKGVDYEGDLSQLENELSFNVAAIAYAIKQYGMPDNLKLSIHSGSDKFSIYPLIHTTMKRFDAGVHLKTAGTTWLEELIGLAETGGDGLELAKDIYAEAYRHRDELCAPYSAVISIDPAKLPAPGEVKEWTSEDYTSALRHVRGAKGYNSSLRQLLHVGFKVAAKMGPRFRSMLEAHQDVIARNVTQNLFERHIAPVFLGTEARRLETSAGPAALIQADV